MSPVESFYCCIGFLAGLILGCAIGAFVFWLITRQEQQELDSRLDRCAKIHRDLEYYYEHAKTARFEDRPLRWGEYLSNGELRSIKDKIAKLYQEVNDK